MGGYVSKQIAWNWLLSYTYHDKYLHNILHHGVEYFYFLLLLAILLLLVQILQNQFDSFVGDTVTIFYEFACLY